MCSELISDFYKELGVMISDKNSSSSAGGMAASGDVAIDEAEGEAGEFLRKLEDALPGKKALSPNNDNSGDVAGDANKVLESREKPSLAIGPYEFGEGLDHRLNLHPRFALSPELRMPILHAGRGRIIDQ